MEQSKTRAIVLRRIVYGETSLIVHVFSEERGRLAFLAKGVRKRGSQLDPVLQTAQEVELVLLGRDTRELYLLKEAVLLSDYRGLRRAYSRLLTAGALCEAVSHSQLSEQADGALYEALCTSLQQVAGDCPYPVNHLYWMLLFLLSRAGSGFDLQRCAGCGRGVEAFRKSEGIGLDRRGGELLCPDCHHDADFLRLSPRLLRVLLFLSRADAREVGQREITSATRRALGDLLDNLCRTHMEHWRGLSSLNQLAEAAGEAATRPSEESNGEAD